MQEKATHDTSASTAMPPAAPLPTLAQAQITYG